MRSAAKALSYCSPFARIQPRPEPRSGTDMHRSSSFQPVWIVVSISVALLLTCAAVAQNYVAPSNPVIGSPNTVTANAPVPRPSTTPCTVTLFQNFDFDDFNPETLQLHASGRTVPDLGPRWYSRRIGRWMPGVPIRSHHRISGSAAPTFSSAPRPNPREPSRAPGTRKAI